MLIILALTNPIDLHCSQFKWPSIMCRNYELSIGLRAYLTLGMGFSVVEVVQNTVKIIK